MCVRAPDLERSGHRGRRATKSDCENYNNNRHGQNTLCNVYRRLRPLTDIVYTGRMFAQKNIANGTKRKLRTERNLNDESCNEKAPEVMDPVVVRT